MASKKHDRICAIQPRYARLAPRVDRDTMERADEEEATVEWQMDLLEAGKGAHVLTRYSLSTVVDYPNDSKPPCFMCYAPLPAKWFAD